MADYLSVVTRYVDGANCSGVSYFSIFSDEDEPMDASTDNADTDEQTVTLLIEYGNLSAEERRLMAQPVVELNKEPIQENPSLKEEEEEEEIIQESEQALVNQEEDIVEELVQALVTQEEGTVEEIFQTLNEKEVVISPVVRTEEAQEKEAEDQNARICKPLPFPDVIAGSLHENFLHPLHNKGNLYERFQRAERELEEEERNKTGNESEKEQPEQSLQIPTEANPIQSMAAESQDNSSNEGSFADGTKLLKSMTSLLSSLQTNVMAMGSHVVNILKTQKEDIKEVAECVKILKELDNTLKKNTLRRTEGERLEYADFIARKFQEKENVKAASEREQNCITQGEPSRRGDGVSIGTRSKRAPTNDENPRLTKRGGGRSGGDRGGRSSNSGRGGQSGGDRGGRSSGSDRGGRSSGSGRGGRTLPPFQNLLTGEGVSGGGFNYPIDPRVKREEQ
ncbi:keratin, type I cytoskeletal 9-like [Impatiens glandulifera]|uniref:keratin, type I cytoskeletal 9-like n=1 Tax=Impatiens glandulifera TaxID=253017 RepID=UPI001FB09CD6|nr:keratin, type I cytoskeletal 9-like [Impatiens glandulifera]